MKRNRNDTRGKQKRHHGVTGMVAMRHGKAEAVAEEMAQWVSHLLQV